MLAAIVKAASQTQSLSEERRPREWEPPNGSGYLGIAIITWSPFSNSTIAPGILVTDLCDDSTVPLTPVAGVNGGGSFQCSTQWAAAR